jgi:hypothetical protein
LYHKNYNKLGSIKHFQSHDLVNPKLNAQLKGIAIIFIHIHDLYAIVFHGLNEQMRLVVQGNAI